MIPTRDKVSSADAWFEYVQNNQVVSRKIICSSQQYEDTKWRYDVPRKGWTI